MKSINSLLKKNSHKLLIIFPHPDDETVVAAGLIQQALVLGHQVKVVCVTNGSLGQIHIHGQGRNVVQMRRSELATTMEVLGVTDWEMWRHCDGLLKESSAWQEEVKQLMVAYQPSIVVTYGPDGLSGHPDHLALGKYLYNYLNNCTNSSQLVWPTFQNMTRNYLKTHTLTSERLLPTNFVLKLNQVQVDAKHRALKAHASQDLARPLEWLADDPSEYFAVPDKNTLYNFDYVDFDLGV